MKLYACLANIIAFGYLATAAPTQAQVTPDSTNFNNVSFTNFSVPESDVARFIDKDLVNILLAQQTDCSPGINCPGDPYYP